MHLEPRAAAVLRDLVEHAGQVRTRDELLDAVWGDAFVGEAALTHCIWELRKAFGDDAKNPSFIQTVPRRGYRLLASVTPIARVPSVVAKTLVAWKAQDSAYGNPDDLAELRQRYEGEDVVLDSEVETPSWTCGLGLFERPTQALRFALALQASTSEPAGEAAAGFSVAVHLGEITVQDRGPAVSGPAVSVVVALCASAHPRQVLTSRGVFDIGRVAAETLGPKQDLRWLAHGDYVLDGQGEPFEVFEVGALGLAPLEAPTGAAGLRSIGVERTVLGWRPAPGQSVPQRPHWKLRRKLGEGGFGEVWLTEHGKTGDKRVFKFCVEVDRLRSLQREVTLFRLLKESLGSRPDITRILDWNFEEAPYFLELEYVEGGSFADWATSRGGLETVPLSTRLEIVAQAGDALAAAHSIGILHKDIKPGNILIGPGREAQPRARLTDFGIGRLTDPGQLADAQVTRLGLTETASPEKPDSNSGTRLYIAPELLEGRMASIQSDIYSLGVVLYQAVVGRFDRAMGPGWRRQIDDPLLRDDIARCVDLAPEHRPQSARGV
ncbi:MAG: winged helix-turn-helix domain-containing protein, partial [Acidobacteriota bacterium]